MAAEVHLASVRPVAVKLAVASVPHVVVKVVAVSVRADPHLANNFLLTGFDKSRWPWPAGFFLPHLNRALGHGDGLSFRVRRFVIVLHKGRHHWFLTIAFDELPI